MYAGILQLKVDRYNRPIFGFCQYIGISQNALSRCWQNAVISLMHPDNLRKEAQWTKSDSYLATTLAGAFS